MNQKSMWVASAVALVMMLMVSAWGWTQIPAGQEVPIHFDVNGNPDRYGSPFWALFTIPISAAFTFGLIGLIPRIEPRQENFQMSAKAYQATWTALIVFMTLLHFILVFATLGIFGGGTLGNYLPVMMGVLFIILGNYMGKVRSNFMFGIRTPWTLSSELSWNKTHRLGGWMMVAVGVATVVIGLFASMAWALGIMIGGLLIMLVVTMVYSWMVYKQDPEVAGV
ncbi:MAG: SdpI family protein [Chloroflexota bacterium]